MAPGGAVPVQEDGTLVGLITAADLADWLGDTGLETARLTTVGRIARPGLNPIRAETTIPEALAQFRADDQPAAPAK